MLAESALAAAAASKGLSGLPANWPGWLVIIAIGVILLAGLLKLLGGGK